MPTTTATDIIIATEKYLTAALIQMNKNPLLQPYGIIKRKALSQLDYIFSNASSALKKKKTHLLTSKGGQSKTHFCTSKGVSTHYKIFLQYTPYNIKTLQISSSLQIQSFSKNISSFLSIIQIQFQPSP